MAATRKSAIALALCCAAGCSKKPEGPSQVRIKEASQALSSAGFKTDALQSADASKFSAQKCVQGQLEGVDTVLCEYGSADAVSLGKSSGEDWVGQAPTGVVVTNGFSMLGLADRSRADPNGKTIQKVARAFTDAR